LTLAITIDKRLNVFSNDGMVAKRRVFSVLGYRNIAPLRRNGLLGERHRNAVDIGL
jgi:hypothetical protein